MSEETRNEQSYSDDWVAEFRTSLLLALGLTDLIDNHRWDFYRNNLPVDFFMDLIGYGLGGHFTGRGNRDIQRFYNRRLKARRADEMLLNLANVPFWVDCIFPA